MDYNSDILAGGWLKDIYGTTPMFVQSQPTPAGFGTFDTRSEPQHPVFVHYEDMDPRRSTYTEPQVQHDYFTSLAHSANDLSSPTPASRVSPTLSVKDHITKITKRKPGRPRTKCPHEICPSPPPGTSARIPHNQVEQKYRHGLNAELVRLRAAIPKIAEWDTDPEVSMKPSKVMVLASAVNYIRELERERDALKRGGVVRHDLA